MVQVTEQSLRFSPPVSSQEVVKLMNMISTREQGNLAEKGSTSQIISKQQNDTVKTKNSKLMVPHTEWHFNVDFIPTTSGFLRN
jgi:hypothetical protein